MEILTIGQKIRNRRRQLNMTLKDLAGERVTAGQLSFVELGKSHPSSELLQYVADKLCVTVDYLLESEMLQALKICEYNLKLSEAYIYDNSNEDARNLLESTVKIAAKYNLGNIMGKIEFNKGKINLSEKLYHKASENFLNANKLFLQNNDYNGAIETYILLGQTSCNSGFYELALSYFRHAEFLSKEKDICDEELIVKIFFCICKCFIKIRNIEGSDEYLPLLEKYLDRVKNKEKYAHKLMEISIAYREERNYDRALYYTNKALDIFKAIENKDYLSKIQMNLGIIYSEKNDIEKSNYYLKMFEKLCDDCKNIEGCCVFLKLAHNYIIQNDFNQAVHYIEKSFNIAIEYENVDYQIECYKCLYKVYSSQKDYQECHSVLKNLLGLLQTVNRPQELTQCYVELVEYYNFMGNKELAIKYMKKVLESMKVNHL